MAISERIIADLHQLCADDAFGRKLPIDDVSRWANELELSISQTFDSIALYIAGEFHAGRLDFAFCDRVVNVLWTWSIIHRAPLGGLLVNVYLAFDEGEYRHKGDDDDPVEKYTKPQVADIVKNHAS